MVLMAQLKAERKRWASDPETRPVAPSAELALILRAFARKILMRWGREPRPAAWEDVD